MPIKRSSSGKLSRKTSEAGPEQNSLLNMFKKIQSDSVLQECDRCQRKIKPSVFKRHQEVDCFHSVKTEFINSQEVIVIDSDDGLVKKSTDDETKCQDDSMSCLATKRIKLEQDSIISKQNGDTKEEHVFDDSHKSEPFDFYLSNFSNAIQSVLNEDQFNHLFDENDLKVVERFKTLTNSAKILYVRLFQRKFKWLSIENVSYERISKDLKPFFDELKAQGFIIDETSIETYEEIIYLFKIPQLKELIRLCHISATQSNKTEMIRSILKHFKTQKSVKSHFFKKSLSDPTNSNSTPNYMLQCKKILGKCFKLDRKVRSIFVRALILFSLSSSFQTDPSNAGQQQLLQILMVNINNVKYVNYEIKLNVKIFDDKQSLLNYEQALDDEFELLNILDSKDYDQAYDIFKERIEWFKNVILEPETINRDKCLPVYLRSFTRGSIYTKILSVFAFEVLQRLKKYQEANDLFEFLLYKQKVYRLSARSKWFERLAINYETHLKDPLKSFRSIKNALEDTENIIFSGRLNLYLRLEKIYQTKKYLKIKEIKDEAEALCAREKYEFTEAPCVEIHGTLLHTSEFLPGRKNVFIDSPSKSGMTISVEQVALNHYINNLGYTNGKHAETSTLTTLYGILFWEIIWSDSVNNVFVDKFQNGPLDLQTKDFYKNRKELVDTRLDLFRASSIENICTMASDCWNSNYGYQCYGVNFELFENLEEFLSLLKCFRPEQLVNLCEHFSKNYRYCRSGGPDLVIWSQEENKVKFVEVKGPGDQLSYKQMIWLDFMVKNSIDCEVCHVKGLNSKRLR